MYSELHNNGNSSNGEVKSDLTEKETEALKEALAWLDPEYPELLPGVLEKVRPYFGTKAWISWLDRCYREAAYEHFKTAPPLPILPVTDEFLRETANRKAKSHRQFKDARDRYLPGLDYFPPLECLRDAWQIAHEETVKVFHYRKRDRLEHCQMQYTHLIKKDLEAIAEELWRGSEEYKAAVEAVRRRKERQAAECEAALAVWEENQRLRREHDRKLTPKDRLLIRYDVRDLCALAEDYHGEFFEAFFSKEYCGFAIEYDPVWQGYWFPKEAGELSELLFSASGTLFLSNGEEKGEKIPEWNYVMTYGHFACGYPINQLRRFSPKDYRRALQGFTAWLAREKGKREGTLFEYDTFDYWQTLLTKVTIALFAERLDKGDRWPLVDNRRNFLGAIKNYFAKKGESLALFPELASEKAFKPFIFGCLEGGKYREISLNYFKLTKSGRPSEEKFELVFNPACLPAEEPSAEEQAKADAHCAELMSGSALSFNPPGEFIFPPEEDPFDGDENARAEAEQEEVD